MSSLELYSPEYFIIVFNLNLLFMSFIYHRENEASLAVLPDLLIELDSLDEVSLPIT